MFRYTWTILFPLIKKDMPQGLNEYYLNFKLETCILTVHCTFLLFGVLPVGTLAVAATVHRQKGAKYGDFVVKCFLNCASVTFFN